MRMFNVIIDASPRLTTFSPVEIVELIMAEAKKQQGEISVDIWETEIK